jgi:hypothetical protein
MARPPALAPLWAFCAVGHDPRRPHPTTLHALATILPVTMLAPLCGAQPWGAIAPWGKAKAAWRAECLALAPGMSSHETCGRVLAVRDPACLRQACVAWMQTRADLSQGRVVLEGQTSRRSRDRAEGQGPMPVGHA